MQLPDETIEYHSQGLLAAPPEAWTPLAELQGQHLLSPARLRALAPVVTQVRSQIASERELVTPPPELRPLEPGFIDLPQKTLDAHRRKSEASDLGRILSAATRLRSQVDRVVVLGAGGSCLGARALVEALGHAHHNELPVRSRMGVPRVYFAGHSADNDCLADLLELFEHTCVDPELMEERWGVVVVSKSGATLETAAAYRIVRNEAAKYYGPHADRLRKLIVPVTGPGGRLRDLAKAQGYSDDEILTIPENVGSRFSAFTAAGLLPAAVMGLDARALLLGAAAMTRRFMEEPFEKNPVLQYAAANYLATQELGKTTRMLTVWSQKLEALGRWYEQLVAESLGKQGRGPTPLTAVGTRDLHTRGQQLHEGPRDKLVNNLVVKSPKAPPLAVGMADRNEDDLNGFARRTLPDLTWSGWQGANRALAETARPTGDLILPSLSEFTLGQVMQLLMLATVVEARLMGLNPYTAPGVEPAKRHARSILKAMANPQG
jgi:glucose-6-phosphate isomerase